MNSGRIKSKESRVTRNSTIAREKIISKIEDLSVGKTFKSYKDFFNFFNLESPSGNTKIAQESLLKKFMEYKKDGNKIIITKIYEEERINLSYGDYGELIHLGIIRLLEEDLSNSESNLDYFIVSRRSLACKLGLTNSECKDLREGNVRSFCEKHKHIPNKTIINFIEEINNITKVKIDTVMKNMNKSKNILCNLDILIRRADKNNKLSIGKEIYDVLDLDEVDTILSIELIALEEMRLERIKKLEDRCSIAFGESFYNLSNSLECLKKIKLRKYNKNDLRLTYKFRRFQERVKDRLEKTPLSYIDFYYSGYQIELLSSIEKYKKSIINFDRNYISLEEIREELKITFINTLTNTINKKIDKNMNNKKEMDKLNIKKLEYLYLIEVLIEVKSENILKAKENIESYKNKNKVLAEAFIEFEDLDIYDQNIKFLELDSEESV